MPTAQGMHVPPPKMKEVPSPPWQGGTSRNPLPVFLTHLIIASDEVLQPFASLGYLRFACSHHCGPRWILDPLPEHSTRPRMDTTSLK